ncbi:leishmanolysin-related zinc metalloendopeptidase [Kiloniella sp.]|uniref:leishmanolysin-related zinc metalloendopeptidase n=1 Tax=Kiloniella sp. TaxID=1938587 RepID=UPI003B028C04
MRSHSTGLQSENEIIDQQLKFATEASLIPIEIKSAQLSENELATLFPEVSPEPDLLYLEKPIHIEELPTPPTEDLAGRLPPSSDNFSSLTTEASVSINLLAASGALVETGTGTTLNLLPFFNNHETENTPYSDNTYTSPSEYHSSSNDLIFLDNTPYAKPDNPGNGNGNGNGGGDDGGGDGGGDPTILDEYLSGDDGTPDSQEFNILIDFKGTWTESLQDAFVWAADWITDIIISDIPDVRFRGKTIDDIKITAELTAIDGEGGVLGQAGPTAIRTDGFLPALGKMEFDSADASYFESIDLWDSIVIHEMLHTVGFGTIWDNLGLISGLGTSTPTFNGPESVLAYADLFSGVGEVPLEWGEGAGTDYSHWDDALFGNEIMTGYISSSNVMTGLTVASLDDLGYDTVDWNTFVEFTV